MNWYKESQTGVRLWLDDERDPSDPYIQQMFGARGDEIWANTVDEALNYILNENVVYISFDHDLGDDPKNGYDLAKWIEEKAFHGEIGRIEWRVHSQNPSGGSNIAKSMEAAERFWDRNEQ